METYILSLHEGMNHEGDSSKLSGSWRHTLLSACEGMNYEGDSSKLSGSWRHTILSLHEGTDHEKIVIPARMTVNSS